MPWEEATAASAPLRSTLLEATAALSTFRKLVSMTYFSAQLK